MFKPNDIENILRNKTLLILDFDGTIADTSELHKLAFVKVLEKYSIPFDYRKIAGQKTINALRNCFKHANYKIKDSELNDLVKDKQNVARKLISEDNNIFPLPGVYDFLHWAKDQFILVVASSGSRITVTLALEKLGYADFFKSVICAEDILNSKPDPEIFLKALSITKCSKNEAIIFEDSDSGIQAAQASGISYIDVRELPFTSIIRHIKRI